MAFLMFDGDFVRSGDETEMLQLQPRVIEDITGSELRFFISKYHFTTL